MVAAGRQRNYSIQERAAQRSTSARRRNSSPPARGMEELLRIAIRAARHHDAKLISVGIAEDNPANSVVVEASHEVGSELEGTFSHVVRIVGVEINVAASGGEVTRLAPLKRHVGTVTCGVAQPHAPRHRPRFVSGECRPEIAESLRIGSVEHYVPGSQNGRHRIGGAVSGHRFVTAKVEAHVMSVRTPSVVVGRV
jgi:hypothetical protein